MQTVASVGFAPTPQVAGKCTASGDAEKGTSFNQVLKKEFAASHRKSTTGQKNAEKNETLTEQDSTQEPQEWMALGMGQLLAATPHGQGDVVVIEQGSNVQSVASVAGIVEQSGSVVTATALGSAEQSEAAAIPASGTAEQSETPMVAPVLGMGEQPEAAVAGTALETPLAEEPSGTVQSSGVPTEAVAESPPQTTEPLGGAPPERNPESDKQMQNPQIASVQADTQSREPAIAAPRLQNDRQQSMSDTTNVTSEDANTVLQKISDALGKAARQEGNGQGEARAGENAALPKSQNDAVQETNQEIMSSFTQMVSEGTQDVEKANAVDKVLSRFVNDLHQLEASPTEIQLMLEPEHLGALTISLSMTESGLSAKIKSADSEICTLIGAQLQHLTDSMRDKGIQVAQLDVVQESFLQQNAQFGQNSFSDSSRQGQASTGQSARRDVIAPVNAEESLAQTVATYFGGGESSDGYRV